MTTLEYFRERFELSRPRFIYDVQHEYTNADMFLFFKMVCEEFDRYNTRISELEARLDAAGIEDTR